jgi:hypothetical protein
MERTSKAEAAVRLQEAELSLAAKKRDLDVVERKYDAAKRCVQGHCCCTCLKPLQRIVVFVVLALANSSSSSSIITIIAITTVFTTAATTATTATTATSASSTSTTSITFPSHRRRTLFPPWRVLPRLCGTGDTWR